MSPKFSEDIDRSIEKIDITTLRRLKYSARTYYVTIQPEIVHAYGLMAGDLLKVKIIEVRKDRKAQPENLECRQEE